MIMIIAFSVLAVLNLIFGVLEVFKGLWWHAVLSFALCGAMLKGLADYLREADT